MRVFKFSAQLQSSVSLLCRILKQMLVRCMGKVAVKYWGGCEVFFPADLKLRWKI